MYYDAYKSHCLRRDFFEINFDLIHNISNFARVRKEQFKQCFHDDVVDLSTFFFD